MPKATFQLPVELNVYLMINSTASFFVHYRPAFSVGARINNVRKRSPCCVSHAPLVPVECNWREAGTNTRDEKAKAKRKTSQRTLGVIWFSSLSPSLPESLITQSTQGAIGVTIGRYYDTHSPNNMKRASIAIKRAIVRLNLPGTPDTMETVEVHEARRPETEKTKTLKMERERGGNCSLFAHGAIERREEPVAMASVLRKERETERKIGKEKEKETSHTHIQVSKKSQWGRSQF